MAIANWPSSSSTQCQMFTLLTSTIEQLFIWRSVIPIVSSSMQNSPFQFPNWVLPSTDFVLFNFLSEYVLWPLCKLLGILLNDTLRSARFQERLLIFPRTRTKTIVPRGFFHSSPAVWNSLPDDLRDPELSIGCFRNKLKTFLFSQIWCLLELVVLYLHSVFLLIMSIVCHARQRDILLAGCVRNVLIDWLIDFYYKHDSMFI